MAIPTYDKMMLPVLQFVADGQEHHIRDVAQAIATYLQLSEEDLNEILPGSRKKKFYDRVQWAKTYLVQSKLVESTGRGLFRITPRGQLVLQSNPTAIDRNYLTQYPEFVEFQNRSTHNNQHNSDESEQDSEQTPEEQIQITFQKLRDKLAEDLLDYVISVSPAFFEQLVIDLLLAMGYGGSLDSGHRIGQSGDGGIDGYIQEDKLGLDIIYIQAKRWSRDNSVGRPEVQGFVGSLMGAGSTKGVFITTSDFSRIAREYAKSIHTHKVILIDGEQLARLMIEHNIGVSVKTTYVLKQIDENYFPDH